MGPSSPALERSRPAVSSGEEAVKAGGPLQEFLWEALWGRGRAESLNKGNAAEEPPRVWKAYRVELCFQNCRVFSVNPFLVAHFQLQSSGIKAFYCLVVRVSYLRVRHCSERREQSLE